MASGKNHIVSFRRKLSGHTDYKQRLGLLKSRKPRLVIRKSLKYVIAQIVEYSPAGDKVIVSVSSKALEKSGWKYSKISVPAAYLTGLMLGKLATGKVTEAIVDLGMSVSRKESRLFAVVKGVIDSGLIVPVSEEILPTEKRINGSHIAAFAEELGKDKDKYAKVFSGYVKQKLDPKKIPADFESVKKSILK